MFRKNLICAAIVTSALSLSTTASAFHRYSHDCWRDAPEASQADFYLGAQYSYVQSNWCNLDPVFEAAGIPAGFKESKCGFRGYAQLDYTQYFGVQLGVTYIDRSSYNITLPTESIDEIISMTITDLTLTARVPMQNNFTYYFKFGAQYTMVKNGLSIRPTTQNLCQTNITVHGSDQKNFNFTCGVGALYPLTERLIVDLGFQHFTGNSDIKNFVADVNMFSAGLAYKFAL